MVGEDRGCVPAPLPLVAVRHRRRARPGSRSRGQRVSDRVLVVGDRRLRRVDRGAGAGDLDRGRARGRRALGIRRGDGDREPLAGVGSGDDVGRAGRAGDGGADAGVGVRGDLRRGEHRAVVGAFVDRAAVRPEGDGAGRVVAHLAVQGGAADLDPIHVDQDLGAVVEADNVVPVGRARQLHVSGRVSEGAGLEHGVVVLDREAAQVRLRPDVDQAQGPAVARRDLGVAREVVGLRLEPGLDRERRA